MKKLFIVIIFLLFSGTWAQAEPIAHKDSPSAYMARLKEANYLLETWQVEPGFKALLDLSKERQDESVTLFLLGKAYFLKGDYDGAVEILDKARAVPILGAEWESFAEFVKQTRDAAKGFTEFTSEHFRLRVKPGVDEVLVPYALDTLEKAYREIGADFDFFPEEKVLFEIYPDFESFNIASSLSKRDMEVSGAIGIAKFNRIMIVSPKVAAHGYRYLDTLTHEYVHYVIYRVTKSEATIWLQEGTAKYEETRWRNKKGGYLQPASTSLLAVAVNLGKKISFAQMEPSLVKLPSTQDVQQAFAQATMAIDYLIQTGGQEKFRKFFWELGQGSTIPEAIEKIVGFTFQTFEEKYWNYIKEKNFQIIPGLMAEGFEFKEGAGGEEDREKLLKKIESTEGQRLALLGDLLFDEKRYAAAGLEYSKALELAANSALIETRLAKTLTYVGDLERAEKLYLQVIAIHPSHTAAFDNLAELNLVKKNLQAAREMLETSNAINPFNPRTHELLALIYTQAGLEEQAALELKSLKILQREK
ncbi:MAG: hypothetical protein HY730_08530 [Candidatus Tectomicrobia bacterium]|uniref:Peptidase MA-like domain-containing protein n=1 Tax=Tectimicrobiota bacterium TaxID=2528274 RepID=A0A933GPR4_UNCTE|nr:hypothetical protein [Candidatus Tectomicrobia bacterium]